MKALGAAKRSRPHRASAMNEMPEAHRSTEHDNMKHKGREGTESKIPKEAPVTGACQMHLSLSQLN